MKATIKTKTSRVMLCPYCSKGEFTVDHISVETFSTAGPWFCDECGKSFALTAQKDGTIDINLRDEVKIKTIDLLVLMPHLSPIYFLVAGMRFEGGRFDDDQTVEESKRFFYEEHSCPTNWLEPEMIVVDGDPDPHGFLEFIATRDMNLFSPEEMTRHEEQEAFIREHEVKSDS